MRKSTSKTNSAYMNHVMSDDPQQVRGIDDEDIEIDIQ
tara:strand:+ start:374 stop:487 length:114 start_codon:yes stop_codon:yes gene_type:complete